MKPKICLNTPKNVLNSVKDEGFRVVFNETPDAVELFLTGIVGDEYTEADSASIAKVLSRNRGKPVTMRVNSPGGLAYDGLAIFNALAGHDGPTTGIIEGLAASAASLAVIGCDTVKMHANATYHIHEGLSFAFGHIADLQDSIEWLQSFNESAVATYAAKTGRPEADIAAELLGARGDGTKFSAEQAKASGYIDEIIPLSGKKQTKTEDGTRMAAMLNFRIAERRLTALR